MTEFDFDELDRSITEAMSKSGLLKEDGQHTEAPLWYRRKYLLGW